MYRATFEGGASLLVSDVTQRHFLRQAIRRGDELTRVRGGYVVTLVGRRVRRVALMREAAQNV